MKRFLVLIGGLTAVAVQAAPGAFGKKSDGPSTAAQATAPGVGAMPFIQMMIALGIVFCIIKFVLPKGMQLMGKKLVANNAASIKIEEGASFAGGHLYVVTARDKTLLLSASQSGVSCLADLTAPKAAAAEAPLFMDILDEEARSPRHSYVDPSGQPSSFMRSSLSDEEIRSAIDRLSKLDG